MTPFQLQLSLLIAQAQRVGKLHSIAVGQKIADGKMTAAVRKAWAAYYTALQKQEDMTADFKEMHEVKL